MQCLLQLLALLQGPGLHGCVMRLHQLIIFSEIDFQSLTFLINILHPQYLPRALCVAEFNILVT